MDQGGNDGGKKTVSTFFISNMDCANEERLVRQNLEGMAGIDSLSFDLSRRRLAVTHSLQNDDALLGMLKSIGLRAARVGQASG